MSYNIYNKDYDSLEPAAGRVAGSVAKAIKRVLPAGETNLTITDESITDDSIIDIYTDIYGVVPMSVEQYDHTLEIVFPSQSILMKVKVTVGLHRYKEQVLDTLDEVVDSAEDGMPAGSVAVSELYGKGLKLLWENPNPANDIADGYAISLNSVDYDFLVVQYFVTKTEWTNGFKRSLSVFTTKGCGFMCSYAYASTSGAVSLARGVKYTNDGLYTTQNCTQSVGAATYTTQNSALIPYKIFGGKF